MSWPNSLPTPIKAGFYRFNSGNPSYQSMQVMVEDRYPSHIRTIYEPSQRMLGHTLNTWFLDVDSKEFVISFDFFLDVLFYFLVCHFFRRETKG